MGSKLPKISDLLSREFFEQNNVEKVISDDLDFDIGKYNISKFSTHTFWIENKEGEGMGVGMHDLAEWIDEIFEREF